jgi:hypothetical protein
MNPMYAIIRKTNVLPFAHLRAVWRVTFGGPENSQ